MSVDRWFSLCGQKDGEFLKLMEIVPDIVYAQRSYDEASPVKDRLIEPLVKVFEDLGYEKVRLVVNYSDDFSAVDDDLDFPFKAEISTYKKGLSDQEAMDAFKAEDAEIEFSSVLLP